MRSYIVSVITVGIDPTIRLGPVTLAWHGLTIAIGIALGGALAARLARRRALDPEVIWNIVGIVAIAGLVGGKLLYLVEHGELLTPGDWLSGRGFSFNGGFVLAAVCIAAYLRVKRWTTAYLDVVALALPLGVAVGRIGDVINGEHYGPPSDWLLAVRNSNPAADVPSAAVAYHSGGLYEIILATLIFALVWPLRDRFRRRLAAVWTVVGLFGIGRFLEFFYRSDSDDVGLGLNSAQWTSLALAIAALVGWWLTTRRWPAAAGLVDDERQRPPTGRRTRPPERSPQAPGRR